MQRKRTAAFTLIELLVVIAIIIILAAILFPVFASVREKGRQATCLSNLKPIGVALELYVQDYDDRMPDCCWWARASSIENNYGPCLQDGITRATPRDKYLPAPQRPPRFMRDKLDPYVRNARIWFCPNVSKERFWNDDPSRATLGFNGTTYSWIHWADSSYSHNPLRPRQPRILVSGLPLAAIPRPTEAVTVYDEPSLFVIKQPCVSGVKPAAHAKGLNALYADCHAKFVPFGYQTQGASWMPCIWSFADERTWEGYFD
jgi:prepilin-type processing-associated H-X9-DG protein